MSDQWGVRSRLRFLALALITVGCILLVRSGNTVAQTPTTSFRDVQGHWAQTCIENLAQQNLLGGYPDGTFRPERSVTRAEFAAIVTRAFPLPASRSATRFNDVRSDYWAADAIQSAYRSGWMAGYPGAQFRPSQPIPRVQALAALTGGLGYLPSPTAIELVNTTIDDAAAIPDYAQRNITAAIEHQLAVNYPNPRRLEPERPTTRGELAAFFCQALAQKSQQVSLVSPQFVTGQEVFGLLGRTPRPSRYPNQEIRGAWITNIDSNVLFSRDRMESALERLDDLNFNTVYPTVWNWGYTLFPSAVAERVIGEKQGLYPDLNNQGRNEALEAAQGDRDMLLEMVELAHARNLSVIPWFEFGFMAPADSALAARHPDWLTQRRDGSRTIQEGEHTRVWLNPFHPQVQQFMLDVVAELMANYAVDGLQIDDHFGLPVDLGYDPYTARLYQQEHGGRLPPANAKDPEWMRWRADKITAFTAKLFQTVKAQRPKAILSVSPNPYNFAYEHYLQDWYTWQRLGYVEELMVQLYRDDLGRFIWELNQPTLQIARQQIPTGIGILTGLKGRPVAMSVIRDQVEAARNYGYAGVSFFFYETIWTADGESHEVRQETLRSLFDDPKPRPYVLASQ